MFAPCLLLIILSLSLLWRFCNALSLDLEFRLSRKLKGATGTVHYDCKFNNRADAGAFRRRFDSPWRVAESAQGDYRVRVDFPDERLSFLRLKALRFQVWWVSRGLRGRVGSLGLSG